MTKVLASLAAEQFAIFQARDGSYVQVLKRTLEGDVLVEAVDFANWEPPEAGRMTPAMRSRLEQIGFRPSDGGNYAFETRIGDLAAAHRLGGQLARTLHEVYGVSADEPLEVTIDSY